MCLMAQQQLHGLDSQLATFNKQTNKKIQFSLVNKTEISEFIFHQVEVPDKIVFQKFLE